MVLWLLMQLKTEEKEEGNWCVMDRNYWKYAHEKNCNVIETNNDSVLYEEKCWYYVTIEKKWNGEDSYEQKCCPAWAVHIDTTIAS